MHKALFQLSIPVSAATIGRRRERTVSLRAAATCLMLFLVCAGTGHAQSQDEGRWEFLASLGTGAMDRGEYDKAEDYLLRAMAEAQKTLPQDDVQWVNLWNPLAMAYKALGRYDEAEPYYLKSIVLTIRVEGSGAAGLAPLYNNLSRLFQAAGRMDEAVTASKRAVAVYEQTYRRGSPEIAVGRSNLANVYMNQGRYQESELLLHITLQELAATRAPESVVVANALQLLGNAIQFQGRHAQALRLFQSSIGMYENLSLADERLLVLPLSSAGIASQYTGKILEANHFYNRALNLTRQNMGEADTYAALLLDNLSLLHSQSWQSEKGVELARESLGIRQAAYGNKHPYVAQSLHVLAVAHAALEDYAKAERLLAEVRELDADYLPPKHPEAGLVLASLARIYAAQGRYLDALVSARQATEIFLTNPAVRREVATVGWPKGLRTFDEAIAAHAGFAIEAAAENDSLRTELLNEAFQLGQRVHTDTELASKTTMESKLRSGSGELPDLLRTLEEARVDQRRLQAEWVETAIERKGKLKKSDRSVWKIRLDELETEIAATQTEVRNRFPGFATLIQEDAVSISTVQEQLHDGEVFVSYVIGTQIHMWIMTRDSIHVQSLDVSNETLVSHIREVADYLAEAGITEHQPEVEFDPALDPADYYPFESADWLYRKLIAPAVALHENVTHLIIVPDGQLTVLPFGGLLTEEWIPRSSRVEEFRTAPWLGRQMALTILPTAAALPLVRKSDHPAPATHKYLGIGSAGSADLKAIAATFEAPEPITLGSNKIVKSFFRISDLGKFSVIAFSSPVPRGDFFQRPDYIIAQPALLLTSPRNRVVDPEYTEATEIPGLGMRPDWLILNCPVMLRPYGLAEDIPVFARAFLYSGARTIIMSYWPVDPGTMTHLTATLNAELRADATLPRAEAMRRAVAAMIDDPAIPDGGDPRRWASMVLMGEGGSFPSPSD